MGSHNIQKVEKNIFFHFFFKKVEMKLFLFSFFIFYFVNHASAGLLDALKNVKQENPLCDNQVLGYRYKMSKCADDKTSVSDWLGGMPDDELTAQLAADLGTGSDFGSYILERQNQK